MSISRSLALLTLVLVTCVLVAPPARAGTADEARRAMKEGDWSRAADAWEKVLEKKSTDREAAMGLAKAAIEGWLTDRYLRAEEVLHKVLEAKAKDHEVRNTLGNLYIALAQSKSDPAAMKFAYEDAKQHFTTVLEADPKSEEAAVGLAQAHWWTAFFDEALGVLDEFLAKGESKGPAHYWRGQVLYTRATDAFRKAGNQLDEAGKEAFGAAKAAYEAATKLDATHFDAWLQLGYANQYLGDPDASQAAYEEAMDVDPESDMPLKGIEALYYHKQDQYVDGLKALAKAHPKNAVVHFFLGYRQLFQEDYDDAIASFEAYAKRSTKPNAVWTHLGRAHLGNGDGAKARDAFEKALRANPGDEVAAGGVERMVQAEHGESAASSPKAALAAAKAYTGLLELAPGNPWVRNNAAFMLRNAVDRHKGSRSWEPVLKECARLYTDGSARVEEEVRGREPSIPEARRFKLAGIVNDTGLMYHYYPEIRDLEKAEEYYLRALELSQDTYGDAFGNLAKLYLEQGKWQEAYDLARDCGEVAKNPDGTPSGQYRAYAASVMKKLAGEGKVSD